MAAIRSAQTVLLRGRATEMIRHTRDASAAIEQALPGTNVRIEVPTSPSLKKRLARQSQSHVLPLPLSEHALRRISRPGCPVIRRSYHVALYATRIPPSCLNSSRAQPSLSLIHDPTRLSSNNCRSRGMALFISRSASPLVRIVVHVTALLVEGLGPPLGQPTVLHPSSGPTVTAAAAHLPPMSATCTFGTVEVYRFVRPRSSWRGVKPRRG